MERPNGAATPGPDAQQAQPIPPAAPGYGYPPPAAPGGYGYPQTASQFPPQAGYQTPPAQGSPYQQPAFQSPFGSDEPNWEAMADENAARSRRRKWIWTGGIVLAACLLGGIVGTAVVRGTHPKPGPVATGTGKPKPSSTVPANSPTVPGQPNLLADHTGQENVAVGPDAKVDEVQGGYALRFASNPNSYGQSADQVVDVTKSFTISAWVYNEAADGYRSAISEGDGDSYLFDLGRDDSNGKKAWLFSVQTAEGGLDATTFHVLSPDTQTVGQWVLLTASYDADQKTISLYVNGAPAGSTKVPGIWAGPGPLEFGRTRHHGMWGAYWAGVMGHIQVWNQALPADQVAAVKNGTALTVGPAHSWLIG